MRLVNGSDNVIHVFGFLRKRFPCFRFSPKTFSVSVCAYCEIGTSFALSFEELGCAMVLKLSGAPRDGGSFRCQDTRPRMSGHTPRGSDVGMIRVWFVDGMCSQ